MTFRPRVSVVIIFLNGETYLDDAIQSVFSQSFTDWELILVDDGSSDSSVEIGRRWIKSLPDRVSLVQHPGGVNRGMSASRNRGLAAARGEFVTFLDADDVWEENALAVRVEEMQRHPSVAMVYGPAHYWWSWNEQTKGEDHHQDLSDIVNVVHEPRALVSHLLTHSEATPQLGTAIFRRAWLEQLGGSVDEFRGMYEDQVLALKFALLTPVFVSPQIICRYRQHAASTCAVSFGDGTHLRERQRFLEWAAAYIAASGVHDSELHRTLQQQTRKATASGSRLRFARAAVARVLPERVLMAARRRLYGQ